MTCINCQNRIEKKLKSLAGIEDAAVDYSAGNAKVTYDEDMLSLSSIKSAIESLGYTTPDEKKSGRAALQAAGILVIILALASLLRMFSTSSIAASFPLAEEGMGYGMLLVIGLLTSVHCIAMCGGINLSQSLGGGKTPLAPAAASQQSCSAPSSATPLPGAPPQTPFMLLLPGVLYNVGRLVSYTAVGFAVGALGSVITVSDLFRNIVLLLAGLFMIIMGLNMLGLFPFLRRLTQGLVKSRLPQFLTKKIDAQKTGRGPLVIGILNGFMPCGPLQAMQLYALSTGSPIKGGISMFLFCIGTIPLMFALGAAGGILSGGAVTSVKGSAFSRRAIQVGAILVAAMGVVMFSNGLSGTGFISPPPGSSARRSGETGSVMQNGVQIINSTLLPNRYPAITVQQGIPVRWIINAPRGSINGCNNRIIIREYGIQHTFKYGDNVIEFMPEKAGRFVYSCWMSMIRSSITVLAPGESIDDVKVTDLTPKPAGVIIPTDAVAVARIEDGGRYQSVEIDLGDDGFEPAIIAVQQGLRVIWTININSVDPGNSSLIFPAYYTMIETEQGPNMVRFLPEMDFDFSTGDNVFYGYVKVTDDISRIDMEAVKADVENHETLIYPQAYFETEQW
jgi:sulfite exporter TauE/SafE/copper chaperone CopZ/plastocyanin domain-containing protein